MAKKNNKPATSKPKVNPMANPTTDLFKAVIKKYLDVRAEKDELFRPMYAKPNKNIDECVAFVIGEVFKANKVGFTDAEVFGLAVHYYTEDKIEITKLPANCYGVGAAHSHGIDKTPMKPKEPSNGKGAAKPTAPSKPTTTPPKSTTPTPQKPTQPSKPSENKTSTGKPQYTASLFDLWQK
jgi:hypothetical protein